MDRDAAARYRINVADVQDAIQTAVGGNAVSQVLQGEQRYDLVLRYQPPVPRYEGGHREDSPAGALRRTRVAGAALHDRSTDGASEIYREGNQRYIAIKYSVRGRDLGSTVEEAIAKVNEQVKLPAGLQASTGPASTKARSVAKRAWRSSSRSRSC